MKLITDEFFTALALDLVLPVALALDLVEHQSVAALFRVVRGGLALMEYVTIDRVGVVSVGLFYDFKLINLTFNTMTTCRFTKHTLFLQKLSFIPSHM